MASLDIDASGPRGAAPVAWCLLVAAWMIAVAIALIYAWHLPIASDFKVYVAGARALLEGEPLYEVALPTGMRLPFTYPPFAAVLLMPLLALPLEDAFLAWQATQVVALILLSWIVARCLPALAGFRRPGPFIIWSLALAAFAGSLMSETVIENFVFAQVNILLVALVLLDTAVLNRGRGILTGLAAGTKVTPGLFLVLMVTTRRWRDLQYASVALCVTLLVPAPFGVQQIWQYWTHELIETDRVGNVDRSSNASLRGVLARTFDDGSTSLWLALSIATLIGGLWVASRWWPRDRMAAASATGATGLLISPISWTHHWIWVVPLTATLSALAVRRFRHGGRVGAIWMAAAALAVALPFLTHARRWIWPLMPLDTNWQTLVSSGYSISCLIGLIALGLTTSWVPARSNGPDAVSAKPGIDEDWRPDRRGSN